MQMERGMDAGPILHQVGTPIEPDETVGALTSRLATLGAEALIEALALMRLGRLTPRPQDPAQISFAPKTDRAVTRIDWNEPAVVVARQIRAFDPVPGAWSELDGGEVKFFGARLAEGSGRPGEVLADGNGLRIGAGIGAIEIAEVHPSGKPRMTAAEWIRGRGIRVGKQLR